MNFFTFCFILETKKNQMLMLLTEFTEKKTKYKHKISSSKKN